MDMKELLQIQVKIGDKSALERLTPEMVTAYFTRNGWQREGAQADAFEGQWHKEGDWIFVHLQQDMRDYAVRIAAILMSLSYFEKRSELAIYVEMLEGEIEPLCCSLEHSPAPATWHIGIGYTHESTFACDRHKYDFVTGAEGEWVVRVVR